MYIEVGISDGPINLEFAFWLFSFGELTSQKKKSILKVTVNLLVKILSYITVSSH